MEWWWCSIWDKVFLLFVEQYFFLFQYINSLNISCVHTGTGLVLIFFLSTRLIKFSGYSLQSIMYVNSQSVFLFIHVSYIILLYAYYKQNKNQHNLFKNPVNMTDNVLRLWAWIKIVEKICLGNNKNMCLGRFQNM